MVKKIIKFLSAAIAMVCFAVFMCMSIAEVSAANVPNACDSSSYSGDIKINLDTSLCPEDTGTKGLETKVSDILNIAFMAIGALSVIFIIIGSAMLVASGGNPDKVKNARHTIIYAIVGLVLAISAYIIVSFVMVASSEAYK